MAIQLIIPQPHARKRPAAYRHGSEITQMRGNRLA
jgi:hypothetical protein